MRSVANPRAERCLCEMVQAHSAGFSTEGVHRMATKKSVVEKVKDAVTGLFKDEPARKSPKRVAAGKKAASTRAAHGAVKSAKTTAKKAVTATKKAATKTAGAVKKAVKKAAPKKTAARKTTAKEDRGEEGSGEEGRSEEGACEEVGCQEGTREEGELIVRGALGGGQAPPDAPRRTARDAERRLAILAGIRSTTPPGDTTMNAPAELSRMITSLEGRVSPEEWQTRLDLAAAYRLVALFGWDDLVYTHITAKIPGTEHYLINPYGLMFDEITASSLIKIDIDGTVHQETPFPINPAGFVIHSAVHAARHDVQCVMHTHTINGVAVSAQKRGLLPISQHSIFVLSSLGYHDYEGVALRDEEKPRLVADLGDRRHLMLRNHGLLTVGATVSAAFESMYFFEASCSIQLRAQAAGTLADGELIEVDPRIVEGAAAMARAATRGAGSSLVWPGLMRRLDRADDSWRH